MDIFRKVDTMSRMADPKLGDARPTIAATT
jgi:hypothetical protein